MALDRWHVTHERPEPEDHCLTIDQLIGYLEATLSPEERETLGEHVARCGLCRDAVEGLAAHPDKQKIRPAITSLNEEIRSRVSAQDATRSSSKIYYAIAAMLLLALTSVLYLTKNRSNERLFVEAFQPYPSAIPLVRGEQAGGKLAEALEKYEAEDYKGTLQILQEIISGDPSNTPAHFYAGIVCLKLGDSACATLHFQNAIKDKGHELAEPAVWYLALAHLQKSDLAGTRSLLNQIVRDQGAYEEKAARLLKRLGQ